MDPLVRVRDLVYRVGSRPLVNGVNLDAMPGEILAIVGPNGAGKSTLCSLIAGDLRPESGEVELRGQPVRSTGAVELARMRSVLPQHTSLGFPFTAKEIALMGRHPHLTRWGSPTEWDHEMADHALSQVKAMHLAERLYPTLSGGEQRRVSLARVLAQNTPVVLLDEPTSSLDLGHQELVMAVCRRLAAEGKAVIAILHDLNLAGAHADRTAVMSNGEIVSVGRTAEVLREGLLSEVFDHEVVVVRHPQTGNPVVLAAEGSSSIDNERPTRIGAGSSTEIE